MPEAFLIKKYRSDEDFPYETDEEVAELNAYLPSPHEWVRSVDTDGKVGWYLVQYHEVSNDGL